MFTDTLQDYKYALENLKEVYLERLHELLGDNIGIPERISVFFWKLAFGNLGHALATK